MRANHLVQTAPSLPRCHSYEQTVNNASVRRCPWCTVLEAGAESQLGLGCRPIARRNIQPARANPRVSVTLAGPSGAIAFYTYDANGLLQTVTYPDGLIDQIFASEEFFPFVDAQHRRLRLPTASSTSTHNFRT